MQLHTIWFILIVILWLGFFVLDGFDFGVGALHMLIGRTDTERRVVINTIGPWWDGNEVWLIVAGGAMFAAFPGWYATLFSAGYLALVLVLVALFARGVSFEYRGKRDDPRWRAGWSWAQTIGSILVPLLLGVALGDLLNGLPINQNHDFTGDFFDLLTGYGLMTGLTLLTLCLLHGATFLALRTTGEIRDRARAAGRVIGAAAIVGSLLVLVIILKRMIYICPPNQVLIFSGGHRRLGTEDRIIGYRVVQGGRGIRIPLVEVVDRMDLTNMLIELRVEGAYSKGGIPLMVQGIANVKVSSKTEQLANAIERFLGMTKEQIMAVARETLEGNLRGVLSTLTPEEVNQDREKFAGELLHEADHDLARLGLELDTLKVQHVSDDKGYLASIGRRQTAELFKRSRIAEAENHALAAENAAQNQQNQEIAKVDAEIATARAEGQRRIVEAQTRKGALIAESKGQVQALLAKATAEVQVQQARLAQIRFKLIADRVKPAEAKKAQMVAQAKGEASRIVEEGKATATAIRSLGDTWGKAGDSARQIFVAQKLQGLVATMMQTVGEMPIDKLTVIDKDLAANGSNFAVKAAVTAEQLKQMLGIDLTAIAQRALPQGPAVTIPPAPPSRPRPPTQPGTGTK